MNENLESPGARVVIFFGGVLCVIIVVVFIIILVGLLSTGITAGLDAIQSVYNFISDLGDPNIQP